MPMSIIAAGDFMKTYKAVITALKYNTTTDNVRNTMGTDYVSQTRMFEMADVLKRASESSRGRQAFWGEVYRNYEFLKGIAHILWHTGEWSSLGMNVLRLLAIQNVAPADRIADAMKVGGHYFGRDAIAQNECLTVGSGPMWRKSFDRAFIQYTTDLKTRTETKNTAFDVTVQLSTGGDERITGVEVSLKPRQWVERLNFVQDANIGIKCDGAPLRFTSTLDWIPFSGVLSFKGRIFSASIDLTPHHSRCLSIAIYRGGIHTLFIHPLGL